MISNIINKINIIAIKFCERLTVKYRINGGLNKNMSNTLPNNSSRSPMLYRGYSSIQNTREPLLYQRPCQYTEPQKPYQLPEPRGNTATQNPGGIQAADTPTELPYCMGGLENQPQYPLRDGCLLQARI